MTLLFTDPLFVHHETGHHPERPMRLMRIWARLEQRGLMAQCRRVEFQPLTPAQVARVHDPHVIERAKAVSHRGGGMLDADTIVSPQSYDVALAAAGACCSAVERVMRGEDRHALCLTRPPGHHATPTRSMGFCLFNNVALAAQHAREMFDVTRILIIDWDVHHGNGTQDIFFADGDVHFLSIHRFGHGFYPGSGNSDETGTGPGLGKIRNVPIRIGTTRREYRHRFEDSVGEMADHCKPDLILLSAGFDAHARDPVGSLGLETDDYTDLTRYLLQVADTHAHGRLVSCLEGGYDLEALADSVATHVDELVSHP